MSDAIPLLTKVDGVVLVSQLGKNTRDAAAFLRERLAGVNAPLLGVVANGVRARVIRVGTGTATAITDRVPSAGCRSGAGSMSQSSTR